LWRGGNNEKRNVLKRYQTGGGRITKIKRKGRAACKSKLGGNVFSFARDQGYLGVPRMGAEWSLTRGKKRETMGEKGFVAGVSRRVGCKPLRGKIVTRGEQESDQLPEKKSGRREGEEVKTKRKLKTPTVVGDRRIKSGEVSFRAAKKRETVDHKRCFLKTDRSIVKEKQGGCRE